jgi:hypothetical protein
LNKTSVTGTGTANFIGSISRAAQHRTISRAAHHQTNSASQANLTIQRNIPKLKRHQSQAQTGSTNNTSPPQTKLTHSRINKSRSNG